MRRSTSRCQPARPDEGADLDLALLADGLLVEVVLLTAAKEGPGLGRVTRFRAASVVASVAASTDPVASERSRRAARAAALGDLVLLEGWLELAQLFGDIDPLAAGRAVEAVGALRGVLSSPRRSRSSRPDEGRRS